MFSQLTGFSKFLIGLVVCGIIGALVYFGSKADSSGESSSEGSSIFGKIFSGSDSYDATIILDTYTGWAPIVWGNGGILGKDDSEFSKRFGVKLKILNIDEFEANRAAWKNGEAQIAYVTLDSYPIETSSTGTMTDARYFMIHNFSAGADAIVAAKGINTVADLKGKKISFSEGTASHSLLLNTLETSGLQNSDVQMVITGYGNEVAQAFASKQVDAAVVFTPDDEACLRAVPGSKIIMSTKQTNTLVTDGFIAKKEWLEKNHSKVTKIIEALLWANSEFTNNTEAYDEGCKVFSQEFGVPLEDVVSTGKKINFATLQDNINWFGLNSDYTGMKGENLYTKMSRVYTSLGLTKSVLPWSKVSISSFIDELSESNTIDNDQSEWATRSKKFTAPTQEMKTTQAISNKKVIINFPTNGFTLDDEAQGIIDREFADIAKQFNTMRIRVEGNTDAPGDPSYNQSLSEKRAKSVADYLIKEYGFDSNRFIIVGNGSKHAKEDGVNGANENYRTTDFQLISE